MQANKMKEIQNLKPKAHSMQASMFFEKLLFINYNYSCMEAELQLYGGSN